VAQFTLKSPRVKVLKILEDLAGRSNVFVSFGAIAHGEIESWMRAASLTIPSDLIEFWCQTGGGDLFDDSETMLRPTNPKQLSRISPGRRYRIRHPVSHSAWYARFVFAFSQRHFFISDSVG
jgi:hypothetical protein